MAGEAEGIKSLDDLRKENEAAEQATADALKKQQEEEDALDADDQDDDQHQDDDDDDSQDDDHSDDDGASGDDDDDGDDDGKKPNESWMQSQDDDDDEGGEKKFTDSDAASIRRKYKAREAKKDDELDELRRENAELKKTPAKPAPKIDKPKREDFKSDEEFQDASADYRWDLKNASLVTAQAAEQRKSQRNAHSAQIAQSVDDHYLRAHALSEKSGIKPEAYKAADLKVREAIDQVFPQDGDSVADYLIDVLGEGSEKVFYHIGVNAKKLEKLLDTFKTDPNGMGAAAYLGTLKAELTAPAKRTTKAPDPGDDIQGDKSNKGDGNERRWKKQYEEAHKKGENQKAFDIKRKAKTKGINTQAWTGKPRTRVTG